MKVKKHKPEQKQQPETVSLRLKQINLRSVVPTMFRRR